METVVDIFFFPSFFSLTSFISADSEVTFLLVLMCQKKPKKKKKQNKEKQKKTKKRWVWQTFP